MPLLRGGGSAPSKYAPEYSSPRVSCLVIQIDYKPISLDGTYVAGKRLAVRHSFSYFVIHIQLGILANDYISHSRPYP